MEEQTPRRMKLTRPTLEQREAAEKLNKKLALIDESMKALGK